MASIQKTAKGYRAQLYVKGVRDSATFPTRREALQWAGRRDAEMRMGASSGVAHIKTLGDALRRYGEEVSPKRKGEHWELLRLAAFARSTLPVKIRMQEIGPEHISAWRDRRMLEVAPGSVLRELGLLSAVWDVAIKEWRWASVNPVKAIRKPSSPAHRQRVIARHEIKALLRAMGYQAGKPPQSVAQAVACCFVLALRTGMRAGEMTGLTWDRVYPDFVRLLTSKTGKGREVPLTRKASALLQRLRGYSGNNSVFGMAAPVRDAMFRRYRDRVGLHDLTFHDARHTAATWIGLSGKLELLELCRAFGWSDPKMAMVYFNPSASALALKLNG